MAGDNSDKCDVDFGLWLIVTLGRDGWAGHDHDLRLEHTQRWWMMEPELRQAILARHRHGAMASYEGSFHG
jgi:hypothetical protein